MTAAAPDLRADAPSESRVRAAARVLALTDGPAAALDERQRETLATFVVGNALFTLTHELGHAAMSEFNLPVLGREEDAADSFAALALLHIGTDFAHRVLEDAARGLIVMGARRTTLGHEPLFYDEHGLDQQRAYQIICFMVGSDPGGFRGIAAEAKLPPERQESCGADYDQARASWAQLLEPHFRSAPPRPSFLDRLLNRPPPPPGQPEPRIDVDYADAAVDLARYRDALAAAGLLEALKDFAARNLAFPHRMTFEAKPCGEPNASWDPHRRRLTLRYELVADFVELGLASARGR